MKKISLWKQNIWFGQDVWLMTDQRKSDPHVSDMRYRQHKTSQWLFTFFVKTIYTLVQYIYAITRYWGDCPDHSLSSIIKAWQTLMEEWTSYLPHWSKFVIFISEIPLVLLCIDYKFSFWLKAHHKRGCWWDLSALLANLKNKMASLCTPFSIFKIRKYLFCNNYHKQIL